MVKAHCPPCNVVTVENIVEKYAILSYIFSLGFPLSSFGLIYHSWNPDLPIFQVSWKICRKNAFLNF